MKILRAAAFAIMAICFFGSANAQVVLKARVGPPQQHRVVVVHRPYHHRRVVVVRHPYHRPARRVVVVHH